MFQFPYYYVLMRYLYITGIYPLLYLPNKHIEKRVMELPIQGYKDYQYQTLKMEMHQKKDLE